MSLTIEMHDPIGTLMRELKLPGVTQASVAITYAYIIAQEPDADWHAINQAICERWKGRTALARVKEMAWKRVEDWKSR